MSHHISNHIVQKQIPKQSLFTDAIKFTINGAYQYIAGSGNSGSAISTTNALTTTKRRYILVRTDTYSNDLVQGNNNTTFTPNETGTYLSIISAELYDNNVSTKTIYLELIELNGSTETSLQMARATFTGTTSSLYEYGRINNTMVITLTAGKSYFYRAYSSNGGVLNAYATTSNFTLLKLNDIKTF